MKIILLLLYGIIAISAEPLGNVEGIDKVDFHVRKQVGDLMQKEPRNQAETPVQNHVENDNEIKNTQVETEVDGVDSTSKEEKPIELPSALNLENFDESTSQQLSFVEFFSPYCHHCKELAPTWEKAYKDYYDEFSDMDVQMRQVNCVDSGDLCEREEVFSYPNLRIYSPIHDRETGQKTGRSKFVTSYPRSLVRTGENFRKFVKNAVAEYDSGAINLPSASKEIDLDNMLKLIAGEATSPQFVMLYNGLPKQWEMSEKTGKSAFNKHCFDCLDNKQIWDKLSNQILTTVATHHFSCTANPDLCKMLGADSLSVEGKNPQPKFIMFLPKSVGIIRFDYRGSISVEALKKFASDLFENYQYENVSAKTLSEIMDFRKSLPFEPLNSYYPLPNKVALVFYYDPKTVTDEDKAILPYLLEYVTYSPFNMYLYVAKSDRFERAINTQATKLAEYASYDTDVEPRKFNKALHLATTLTTKPTIFVIKDNALFTPVFQSYAPEDIRSSEKVLDFVNKNMFPLYQELTPELFDYYFDETKPNKQDKVVITFLDSSNAKKTDEALYKLSLAVHEYQYNKNEYYFNDILDKRQAKQDKVELLKKQNADSVKIIREMRKEVPHLFDNNQVLFTFIDLASHREFADIKGWNINSREFKDGDTVIVTRDNSQYWDQDLSGSPLRNDPKIMRHILKYLLDPKLIDVKVGEKEGTEEAAKIEVTKSFGPKLVGSPYGASLRFMDHVHKHGFFGYLLLVIGLVVVVKGIKVVRRRRTDGSQGILGESDKYD